MFHRIFVYSNISLRRRRQHRCRIIMHLKFLKKFISALHCSKNIHGSSKTKTPFVGRLAASVAPSKFCVINGAPVARKKVIKKYKQFLTRDGSLKSAKQKNEK